MRDTFENMDKMIKHLEFSLKRYSRGNNGKMGLVVKAGAGHTGVHYVTPFTLVWA